MKNKRTVPRLIALALAVITLVSLLSLPFATAAEGDVTDLSKSGSQYTETVDSAALLELLLGEELPEVERSYLLAYGEHSIKYDSGITTATIHVDYSGTTLSLTVYEHKYTSDSGKEVVWIPDTARLGALELPLVYDGEGGYKTTFTGVKDADETTLVNVSYVLSVKIPKESANSLLNFAYDSAVYYEKYIADRQAEHTLALEQYEKDLAAYNDYLVLLSEYDSLLDAYNIYVEKKRENDLAWDKYNEYLTDLETFEKQTDDYEKYQSDYKIFEQDWKDYGDYLEKKKNYDNLKAIYDAEMSKVVGCREKLAIIELTRTSMTSLNRDVYSAIMGGLVDTVLARREDLESSLFEAPPRVIDMAGEATEVIRVLLSDYFALSTEAARYNYYTVNYTAFRDNFIKLFTALDCLYSNGKIRAAIINQDKNEKYKILVAQLYLIATALSDTPVYSVDPSLVQNSLVADRFRTRFKYDGAFYMQDGGKCTASMILEGYSFVDKNSATPTGDGFPSVPTPPDEPDFVEEPTEPDVVLPPGDEPEKVEKPDDPPTVVDNPGKAPTPVAEPHSPEPYVPAKEIADLVSAKGITVTERDALFDTDPTVTFKKTVEKRFVNIQTVDIAFLDEEGNLLYLTTVDSGTAAVYSGPLPTKAEDQRAVYTFAGWKDNSGRRVDLSEVSTNLSLTPYFDETVKSYTVSWDIDGNVTSQTLPYGTLPSCPDTPKKPSTLEHKFVFVGWDKEIAAVSGDVTYTAIFRADSIISSADKITVSFDSDSGDYVVDAPYTYDPSFDLSNVLLLSEGKAGIRINARFASFYLDPKTAGALADSGVARISLVTSSEGELLSGYSVRLYNAEGQPVYGSYDIPVSVSPYIGDTARMRLYALDGEGNRRTAKYRINGTRLEFTLNTEMSYLFGYAYMIKALSTSSVTVSVPELTYLAGERVDISVLLADGKRLEKLCYLLPDGGEVSVPAAAGCARLVMPALDITLTPLAVDILYTVVFKSDGQVITTLYCRPGEMPTLPEAPRKADDGEFTYSFAGWSDQVVAANGNKTYEAVYEKTAIEIDEESDAPTSYYRIIAVFFIVLVSLMCAAVVFLIVAIVIKMKNN